MVGITVDTRKLRRQADRIGRTGEKNFPRAVKTALDITAARARRGEQENMRQKLDRPKAFTLNAVGFRKTEQRGDMMVSAVFAFPIMEGVLFRLEFGGQTEGAFVNPKVQDRWGGLGYQGGHKLLRRPNTFRATIGGRAGIWRRPKTGPDKGKLQLLVGYYDRVVYTPMLGWREKGFEVGEGFQDEAVRQFERIMSGDAR